ncbi:MAG: efflux RND transporter periplasmic adaptor subunit [Chloroflexi bacterium]|nr:efflux RND transporter periplasmic adaptor subunit [Chloroflexota bacterium]
MKKRWIWIAAGVLAVVVIAVLVMSARARSSAASSFQTEEIATGSLTAQVGATGTVHANQSATLMFQTAGTVDKVTAKAGDQAKRDEILAELERTSLSANVILAQADLVEAERALEDVLASNTAKAQAELALANAEDAQKDAEYRWTVQQEGYRASPETIRAAEAKLLLANEEVNHYKALHDRASGDSDKALTLVNLHAAEQRRDTALRELNWYKGKPTDSDQAILDSEVAVAEAALEDARRAYERVKDGPNEGDVAAAQARVDAARASLELAQISAPFAGTITSVDIKPGDLVTPGTAAFGLADLSHLLVDVEVSEVDIDSLKVGQDATLTFDAIQDKSYQGKVTEVGQVGVAVQGVVNFEVEVEVLDPDDSIKPGMTAAVDIVVTQLEDVLLIPNRSVRVQDGQRVVYVMRDGQLAQVKITLGASSDSYSQILEGDLKAGDLIVLNPPLVFSENSAPGFVQGMRGG